MWKPAITWFLFTLKASNLVVVRRVMGSWWWWNDESQRDLCHVGSITSRFSGPRSSPELMWWCGFIDWFKFETRPSSLRNSRIACSRPQRPRSLWNRGLWGRGTRIEWSKGLGTRSLTTDRFWNFKGRERSQLTQGFFMTYTSRENCQNCRSKEQLYCYDQGKKCKSYLVWRDEGIT